MHVTYTGRQCHPLADVASIVVHPSGERTCFPISKRARQPGDTGQLNVKINGALRRHLITVPEKPETGDIRHGMGIAFQSRSRGLAIEFLHALDSSRDVHGLSLFSFERGCDDADPQWLG